MNIGMILVVILIASFAVGTYTMHKDGKTYKVLNALAGIVGVGSVVILGINYTLIRNEQVRCYQSEGSVCQKTGLFNQD